MLDMTMPVLFAILIGVLALITVGSLIAVRLVAERRSEQRQPVAKRPAAPTSQP